MFLCWGGVFAKGLIHELDIIFPFHAIMDALGIVYP